MNSVRTNNLNLKYQRFTPSENHLKTKTKHLVILERLVYSFWPRNIRAWHWEELQGCLHFIITKQDNPTYSETNLNFRKTKRVCFDEKTMFLLTHWCCGHWYVPYKLFYIKLIFFNLSICQNIKVQCKDYISELGVHGGGWAGSQCM